MKKSKGRPPQSRIRQQIIEILNCQKSGYGYQISKLHTQLFTPATRRVIYYHLRKGVETGELEIDKVEKEVGSFSWGPTAEKTYYKLGKNAKPQGDPRVREIIEKK